jgi:hypothetical protein
VSVCEVFVCLCNVRELELLRFYFKEVTFDP